MNADPASLDLDRPHAARANQEMVEFAPTVGVATNQRPLIRQHAQIRCDLVLGGDARSLPGKLVRPGRISTRPASYKSPHLAAVTKTPPELPPVTRRRLVRAQPVHSLTVFDDGPPLAGNGVLRPPHLIYGMIRQLDNTHCHTLTT
jgi:hypothetical protein